MSFNFSKTKKKSISSNKRIKKSKTTTNIVSNFFHDKLFEDKNSEAKILLTIKDIKYGDKKILNPEITTIYKGRKINLPVPFKKPLEYDFEKVEDEMIFKYAVNGTTDLLGFLYLEIPHKFKAIKEFSLDDWFPIKQIETEDEIALQMQNFVVRVIVKYKAKKKFKIDDRFENNMDIKKGYQKLALNFKTKIRKIHNEIDDYEGEGLNHLKEFEKKMLNKKMKMRKWEKKKKTLPDPKNHINQQKHRFYKNKNILGKSPEIKNHKINPEDLYPFEEGKFRIKGAGKQEYNEKLFKELCLTRKDLIEAKQKISDFEEGLTTIDNKKLKKLLEKKKKDLHFEREKLAIKNNEQNALFEEEKLILREDFNIEKKNLDKLRNETRSVLNLYEEKLNELEEEKINIQKLKYDIRLKEKQIEDDYKNLENAKKEHEKFEELLNDKNDEIDDVKKRIMAERNQILKEGQDNEYLKGDIEVKLQILESEKEVLEDKKRFFDEDCKNREKKLLLDERKSEGQNKLLKMEKQIVEEDKKNIERKMKEILEDKKQMKVEGVRLWKEKTKNQEEIKEFMEWKKVVDKEYNEQQRELEGDYDYIDKQLQLIEKNKAEFDNLKGHLEQYETYLENQERIHNEQNQRFNLIQKQFFMKLKSETVEIEDLRTFADKFEVDYSEFERKREETNKLTSEIDYQKDNFKKTINNITLDVRDVTLKERKKSNIIRKKSRMSRMSVFGELKGFEREFRLKIKQDADKIIENMFLDVMVKKLGYLDKEKDHYIKNLENTVEYLNDNTFIDHNENTSHDNNYDVLKVIEKRQKSFSEIKDKNRSPSFGLLTHNKYNIAKEVRSLETKKDDIYTLCDETIKILEKGILESEFEENRSKIEEKIMLVDKCKTVISSIFRFLTKFHRSKHFDNDILKSINLLEKDVQIEEIRKKYERKIRLLVDYIKKVKTNSNFFNYNVDNDILVNK